MMSGRRLAAVVALAALAPLGLVACQSDPAVAAYVGDTEISEARVDGVVDALRTTYQGELEDELAGLTEGTDEETLSQYRADGRADIENRLGDARERVLMFLVLTEATERYIEGLDGEEISIPDPDLAPVAEQQQLPEDHPYVQVEADFRATVGAVVRTQVEPAEPNEADQREVFDHVPAENRQDVQFEDVQPLLTADLLGTAVGIRDLLALMVEQAEVRVQPGYDLVYQVPVNLGGVSSWLGVPIGDPGPVQDAG